MTKRNVILACCVLLLLVGIGWAVVHFRTDPQLVKVEQLAAELTAVSDDEIPPEQRRARWEQFREAVELLPEGQREAARQRVFDGFQERQRKEIATFFTLSPGEQTAFLDKQIDRSEQRRREWQSRGDRSTSPRTGGNGNDRRNSTAEDRNQRRKRRLDNTTPETRAQFDEYRRRMDGRRRERGLPIPSFPGRTLFA